MFNLLSIAVLLATATKILTKMESTNKKEKNLSGLTVRFLSEVEKSGISFYQIAIDVGVKESMFTKIKQGIQEPSKKFLNKFFECYPEMDKHFILVGESKDINEDIMSAGIENIVKEYNDVVAENEELKKENEKLKMEKEELRKRVEELELLTKKKESV